jgi:hypothetical protein
VKDVSANSINVFLIFEFKILIPVIVSQISRDVVTEWISVATFLRRFESVSENLNILINLLISGSLIDISCNY